MRKETFLLIVGLTVFFMPLLGIPEVWKAGALFVLGVSVVLVAISCRIASRKKQRALDPHYIDEHPETRPRSAE